MLRRPSSDESWIEDRVGVCSDGMVGQSSAVMYSESREGSENG